MEILNLTQHKATEEQIVAGVVEPRQKSEVQAILTFDDLPSREEIAARAERLAEIADEEGAVAAMIGGAPYLMGPLEAALRHKMIIPYYAFSRRESIEEPTPDGGVRKTTVFRHVGFVVA